jgi:TorA maturation chaperone TorD
MSKYSHKFVEIYDGVLALGLEREIDESSLICYLQMFSDDLLLKHLVPRLSEQEMQELLDRIYGLLKAHLSDEEYHSLFLKQED